MQEGEERASMRTSLLAGGIVVLTAVLAVLLGAPFGLELDSYALIGVAMGAVVALVPDGRPGLRLTGFASGVLVTWIGYLVRAALLPDTVGGRAAATFLVLALCVAIAAATRGRVPVWSTFAGAATFFGAYEAAFVAAPPEVATTSLTALTAVALTGALGFLAASFVAPVAAPVPGPVAREEIATEDEDLDRELEALAAGDASLDEMMESSK
jgi:hypothetical protein